MLQARVQAGVGLGWRPELAADLLRAPESVDFLEVVADTCFAQLAAWREARALAEWKVVVPHGVKLSLGSADGIDMSRARKLGALARELRAPAISEHVAFTRGGAREIGHLTSLPFTRDAVRVVARNVSAARRVWPDVPVLLENVAWTFRWPEDELSEGDFYAEIAAATGCELLLDVANLFANAINSGVAPSRALREFPLDRVGMLHVAGGVEEDGFYLDTHADPVPDAVFALAAQALAQTGPLAVLLERDQGFPPFAELVSEIETLRTLVKRAPARERTPARAQPGAPLAAAAAREMTARQARVAEWLTTVAPPAEADARSLGVEAVARTRTVLQRKRLDEALPLLPRTSAAGDAARSLAWHAVRGLERAPRGAGIADALRIADAAVASPELAAAALRDRLELRSRFARRGPSGSCMPRRGPFLGRERLPDGRSVWAFKGPGITAAVRTIELGGEG